MKISPIALSAFVLILGIATASGEKTSLRAKDDGQRKLSSSDEPCCIAYDAYGCETDDECCPWDDGYGYCDLAYGGYCYHAGGHHRKLDSSDEDDSSEDSCCIAYDAECEVDSDSDEDECCPGSSCEFDMKQGKNVCVNEIYRHKKE